MTITLTNDDSSTVVFVDPAGVQAAVTAAIAAIPSVPTVELTDSGITVTHTDGSSQEFIPATSDSPNASVETPVAEVPAESSAPEVA